MSDIYINCIYFDHIDKLIDRTIYIRNFPKSQKSDEIIIPYHSYQITLRSIH